MMPKDIRTDTKFVAPFPVLKCPDCRHEFMHQETVGVYRPLSAKGEATEDMAIEIDGGETTITRQRGEESNNPSDWRQGIVIGFSCESCGNVDDLHELVIEQHKGNEFIYWRDE